MADSKINIAKVCGELFNMMDFFKPSLWRPWRYGDFFGSLKIPFYLFFKRCRAVEAVNTITVNLWGRALKNAFSEEEASHIYYFAQVWPDYAKHKHLFRTPAEIARLVFEDQEGPDLDKLAKYLYNMFGPDDFKRDNLSAAERIGWLSELLRKFNAALDNKFVLCMEKEYMWDSPKKQFIDTVKQELGIKEIGSYA